MFNLIDNENNKSGKGFNFSLFGFLDNKDNTDSNILKQLSKDLIKYGVGSDEVKNKISKLGETQRDFAQDLVESKKHVNDMSAALLNQSKSLNKATIASKAAAIGMQALSIVGNMALMAVISLAVQQVTEWVQSAEKARKAAIESANALKEQVSSLDEYKKCIISLRSELDSGNLSEQEAYDKRTQLIDIQNQLIDKYGSEASGINLVTGEIEKQTKAVDALAVASYEAEKSDKQKAYNNAVKYMNKTYDTSYANTLGDYKVEESLGKLGYKFNSIGLNDGSGLNYLNLDLSDKTRTEIIQFYDDIFTIIDRRGKQLGVDYSEELGRISDLKNKWNTEKYQEEKQNYVMYTEILVNTTEKYRNYYQEIQQIKKDYDSAVLAGDMDSAEKFFKQLGNFKVKLGAENISDKGVSDFFNEIIKTFEKESIKVKIKTEFDVPENEVKKALSVFDGKSDIDILNKSAFKTEEEMQSYIVLNQYADKLGISIDELIAYYVELGIVNGKISKSNANVADSFAGIYDSVNETQSKLKNTKAALANLKSDKLTTDDVIDLIEEFPSIADGVDFSAEKFGNLQTVLESLSSDLIKNNIADLKERLLSLTDPSKIAQTEALIAAFEKLQNTWGKEADISYSDSLGNIIDKTKLYKSLQDEIKESNHLTAESLDDIIGKYPELTSEVTKYIAGMSTEKQLMDKLKMLYDDDTANYKRAQAAKLSNDSSFYNTLITKNAELVTDFNRAYGIDLNNFTNLAKAKLAVEGKLLTSLSSAWRKYLNVTNGQISGSFYEMFDEKEKSATLTSGDIEQYIALNKASSAIKALDNIIQQVNFDSSKLFSSSSSSDAYKASVDALWKYKQNLETTVAEIGKLESELSLLEEKDYQGRTEAINKLMALKRKQQQQEHDLANAGRNIIKSNIESLKKYGFQIEYTAETNVLLFKNLDKLKSYSGKTAKKINDLVETTKSLNEANIELSSSWWENEQAVKDYRKELVSLINTQMDVLTKEVDYKMLVSKTLMESYEEGSDKYLSELKKQEGYLDDYLKIAEQKLQKYADIGLAADSDEVREAMTEWWNTQSEVIRGQKEAWQKMVDAERSYVEKRQQALEDQQSAINDILNLTKELIKKEKEDQIDALELQKDKYADIVNAKKASLKLSEDEYNITKEVGKKTASISDLQSRIDELKLDDSREALTERMKLEEELATAIEDLADYQHEKSISKQEEALDKELNDYEKLKDNEIQVLKDYLNKSGQLTQDAMNMMQNQGSMLYSKLIDYNSVYGDGITSNIVSAWDKAIAAISEYGSIQSALSQSIPDYVAPPTPDYSDSIKPPDYNAMYEKSDSYKKSIIAQMKANSARVAGKRYTDFTEDEKKLHEENKRLAALIGAYHDSHTGRWYLNGIPLYHRGLDAGYVGKTSGLKANEKLAILKSEELVMNQLDIDRITSRLKLNSTLINSIGEPSVFKGNIDINMPVSINGDITNPSVLDSALSKLKQGISDAVERSFEEKFKKRGGRISPTLNALKV